jgi:RNA polymerase sigma-70 factor (ECF subfamily)
MTIFVNDRALLERFRRGDRESLERVYWVYVAKIESILRAGGPRSDQAWVPGVSSVEIEDLVQEVFSRAFAPEARRAYDGLRPYGPYLFSIARNALADWWRRHGREVAMEINVTGVTAEFEVTDDDPGPYADPRTTEVVDRFVRELGGDLRAVHEKRFVLGLSQRDAAAALGIGRQSLRTLEARLTARLREALEAEDQAAPTAVAVAGGGRRGRSTETP